MATCVESFEKAQVGDGFLWILIIMYIIALLADFLSPTSRTNSRTVFCPSLLKYIGLARRKLTAPYIYAWVMERDPETYKNNC